MAVKTDRQRQEARYYFFVNSTETSLSDPDPQASLPGIASVRNVVMTSRKEKKMKRKAASHTHRSIQKKGNVAFWYRAVQGK